MNVGGVEILPLLIRGEKMDMDRYLQLGEIVNTHGVHGEVRALSWGDSVDELLSFPAFFVGKEKKEMKVEAARLHKNSALIKFVGIDAVEQAALLKKSILYMEREKMEPLPKGRFYIADLVGLYAYLENGEKLGRVKSVLPTGANDLFVIEGENKEYYVPFIESFVSQINMDEKKMVITPIEGLLSL